MHAYISTENLRSVQSTEEQEEAGSPTSVAQVDGVIRRVTSAPHPRAPGVKRANHEPGHRTNQKSVGIGKYWSMLHH